MPPLSPVSSKCPHYLMLVDFYFCLNTVSVKNTNSLHNIITLSVLGYSHTHNGFWIDSEWTTLRSTNQLAWDLCGVTIIGQLGALLQQITNRTYFQSGSTRQIATCLTWVVVIFFSILNVLNWANWRTFCAVIWINAIILYPSRGTASLFTSIKHTNHDDW